MSKIYYYRCVQPVSIVFKAQQHRKERQINPYQPQMVDHEIIFMPDIPGDPNRPAMILATDRPIATHFLEEKEKMVSRYDHDTRKRVDHPTKTKIKFELMEKGEWNEGMEKFKTGNPRTVFLQLRELDYEPVKEEVSS
jgi:hypothetical protein